MTAPSTALSTESCRVSGCRLPAITGDGDGTPCWACLYRFADAAARPEILSDGEAAMLLEAHGDVVELHGPGPKARPIPDHPPYQHWH